MRMFTRAFVVLTVLVVSNVHAAKPCYDGPNNTGTQYRDGERKPGVNGGLCKDGVWINRLASVGEGDIVKDASGKEDSVEGIKIPDPGFENQPIKKTKKN